PRGIFPLKRFFGGGTVSASGDEVAWDTVRLKLHEIIDHENKQNPFSDDELVGELAKHGLTVARRTVTKYRKAMNIPSSRQRRDWTISGDAPATKAPAEDITVEAAAEPSPEFDAPSTSALHAAGGNGHHRAVARDPALPLSAEGPQEPPDA
ncbi:MAG: hypothetical protein ACREHD_23305, partial [Pirellulales bacterium]